MFIKLNLQEKRHKSVFSFILIGILVFSLIGCGGGKKMVDEDETPDWYLNPPRSDDYLYGVNSSTSQKMQLALDKAKVGARNDIAQQMEVKMQSLEKSFEEEIGSADDSELNTFYNQTMKAIASQTLNGSRVKKQDVQKEGKSYRAYVLMELPLNDFREKLVNRVKNNQQLYQRFRASQAFEDMENDVKEYEEYKQQQGQ